MPEKKKSWADRMTGFMEKIAPVFDQPILASIRDGFVALMPLIIIGAIPLVVLQFPLCFEDAAECYLDSRIPESIVNSLWTLFDMCFGLFSLYIAISVSYSLARLRVGSKVCSPYWFKNYTDS